MTPLDSPRAPVELRRIGQPLLVAHYPHLAPDREQLEPLRSVVLERARPEGLRSADWIARQRAKVEAGVADAEKRLEGRPWFVGDAFGLADIAVGCMLGYLDLRLPEFAWRPAAPGLARWFEQVGARESFRATQPSAQPINAVR